MLTLVPPGVSVKRLEDSVDQALSQVKEREKCHDALKQLDLELEGVVSTDETAAVAMEALRGAIHGAQRLHLMQQGEHSSVGCLLPPRPVEGGAAPSKVPDRGRPL